MPELIDINQFDSFKKIKDITEDSILEPVIETIKQLNEKTQLEPFIRSSIYDLNDTPHGPAEIVDILTTKISYNENKKYTAIIIKGKSFGTITPRDISHQIFRLRKIDGVEICILAFTGKILDHAKDEFISTCIDIDCDYSIWDCMDLARLFVSEGYICPRDGNIIQGLNCVCGYSPERLELNVLQKEALKELEICHTLNQESGLIVLPTGTGKTRIAAIDAENYDANCVLYMAHAHEILDVAEREFANVFGKDNIARISNISDLKSRKKINLATIQLLHKNLSTINSNFFDYIVIDEFHHAAAQSYRKLIETTQPKFLLGLTATPFRGDRQDILELCNGNYIIDVELRQAIELGILSPYHYIGCFDDVDYTNIEHNGITYDVNDLERALIIPERDEAVIEKWREMANNKPTIGFCCTQLHAERCCTSFNDAGIKSEVYLSYTTIDERDRIVSQLKRGEIKVIFTVDVLNEGADFPFIECLLFLRPTESKRIFFQQLGRGLRRYTGKSKAVVLDFIGNFINAYKIVEYVGLIPSEFEERLSSSTSNYTLKEILNLPLGCDVTFEKKVIDIFCNQIYDPRHATRQNIARILIYRYLQLCQWLGRRATKKDVDRYSFLHSELYEMVFGTWKAFMGKIGDK